jgi:hypothetical protein
VFAYSDDSGMCPSAMPALSAELTRAALNQTIRRLSLVIRSNVAVGTTIAGRPPHRSVRARLRIRLLPRMNAVEALVGIRMQNVRLRNPPVEQGVETVPPHLRPLTATNQNASPQSTYAPPKDA